MNVKVSQRVSTRTPVRLGSCLDTFVRQTYCACGHHRLAHEASAGACHGLERLGGDCPCQTFRLEPPR